MANLPSNAPNGHQLASTFDLTERRNARKIETFAALIAFLVVLVYVTLLSVSGHSPYLVLIAGLLLIPTVFLHEMFHYVF